MLETPHVAIGAAIATKIPMTIITITNSNNVKPFLIPSSFPQLLLVINYNSIAHLSLFVNA